MNKSVRKLTDGAMMCAIVGVMLLINRQTGGLLQDIFLYLFPLPMVFFAAKYGFKNALVVLVAIFLLALTLGTPQTVFYVGAESIIGLVYGSGIHRKQNTRTILIVTMLISVLVNVISVIILAKFFGYDMNQEMQVYETTIQQMTSQAGVVMPPTMNVSQLIRTALIVSVILTGIIEGYITHVFSRLLLQRMHFDIPKSTPIAQYYPPVWSGYVALFGVVVLQYALSRPFGNELVQNIVQGLGMCAMMYLSVFGYLAIVLYFTRKLPKFKWLGMFLGLFLMVTGGLLVSMLGFLYITTGWHRKMLEGDIHAAKNV